MEFAQLEAYAGRFYGGRPLLITPYAYTVTFSSLAPAATANQIVNIAANADFIVTEFHTRANVGGAAQTISNMTAPQVRMLVTDSGSNEQFTQSAVDILLIQQLVILQMNCPTRALSRVGQRSRFN